MKKGVYERAARPRTGVIVLAAILAGLWAIPADLDARGRRAPRDPRAQAIEMVKFATALSNMGNYPRAVRYFNRALRLAPDLVGAWRNLGVAYESLKKWKEAEAAYERYLGLAGNTGRFSMQVMARVNACRKEQGLQPKTWTVLGAPGKIQLEISHPGATIRLDGLVRGSSPSQALPVNAGPHVIEVQLVGFITFSKSIVVKEGQTIVVRVELQKDPSYVPPRRVEPIKIRKAPDFAYLRVESQAEGLVVLVDGRPLTRDAVGYWLVTQPRDHVVEVRAPGRLTWRARLQLVKGEQKTLHPVLPLLADKRRYGTWGWVSLGLAAAIAGTGGIFGILENKTYESVRDRRTYIRESLEDMAKRGRLYGHVALGLYAAAGAALTASIVLFVYERRGEHPTGKPLPLVVAPTERGPGLTVTLTREVDF